MSDKPFNIYHFTLEELKAAVEEQLLYTPNITKIKYSNIITEIRISNPLYCLKKEYIQTIWNTFRNNEVLDLHLRITGDWFSRMLGYGVEYNLQEIIGRSITFSSRRIGLASNAIESEHLITDPDFFSTATDWDTFFTSIEGEQWFLVLILLIRHLGWFKALNIPSGQVDE